jgi:N-acetylglucosamine kinase-like BadF-type ATPase
VLYFTIIKTTKKDHTLMDHSVVIGIDGGATKTVAVVMDQDRQEIGRSQSGSTNWNSVGLDLAHAHLREAIFGALAQAGRPIEDVQAVCIGASGVDRPPDRERMTGWLRGFLPRAALAIHNDAVIALASGTGGEIYGVVLISGTGMIVYGFDRAGNRARAGGWGALLGDPGSGYALGAEILKAVTWAVDGRGPATALTEILLGHLGLERPQQLVDWAYRDIAWERFAALAPLAIQCAEDGDAVAQRILAEGAAGLAVAVKAVVAGLKMAEDAFPLVLAGGNLRPGPFQDQVSARILAVAPNAILTRPELEPVIGAGLLAISLVR